MQRSSVTIIKSFSKSPACTLLEETLLAISDWKNAEDIAGHCTHVHVEKGFAIATRAQAKRHFVPPQPNPISSLGLTHDLILLTLGVHQLSEETLKVMRFEQQHCSFMSNDW